MCKLVSVITTCYNGESYVRRFLDSLLAQTYPNIEFIFVNDGSTDDTESIVLSYEAALEEKGIRFTYISQENKGVASATNAGLKAFTGEYLTWPDSDDWMTSDCIEKKVRFLENNPDVGIVIGKAAVVHERDLDKVTSYLSFADTSDPWIFERLILMDGVYVAPIGNMVRSKLLIDAIPSRHIYEEYKYGQNWQILLPITYKNPCGFLDDVVGYYLVRDNSISHKAFTFNDIVIREKSHEDVLMVLIGSIDMPQEQKEYYCRKVRIKYARFRLHVFIKQKDRGMIKKEYKYLRKEKGLSKRDKRETRNYVLRELGIYGFCASVFRGAKRVFGFNK